MNNEPIFNNPPTIPTNKKHPNITKALSFLNLCLTNELWDEAIATAKEWPDLIQVLPESLRHRLLPKKVTPKTTPSLNIEIHLSKLISIDPDIKLLKDKVRTLAALEDAVLILGETGVGKELIAHALHGARRQERFVPLNCAGLPEHLIESELFGHKKGAFTGADSDKQGMMEAANDGTFFLDEIGELPLAVQAKFLRAIQESKVRPVGSNVERVVSCRIVAASHHDLEKLVEKSLFREDLYARLSTFELYVKPIRERLSDIEEIIKSLDHEGDYDKVWKGIDWSKVRLKHNYRSLQKIVKRYTVFKELPRQDIISRPLDKTIEEQLNILRSYNRSLQ